MNRWLLPNTQPSYARELAEHHQLEVITPQQAAARVFRKGQRSLQNLATEILLQQKLTVASPLHTQQALRLAIQQTHAPQDLEGTTRTWLPTIQTLLRSAPALKLSEELSERAKQLIQVAQAYQTILRQQNLVDAAEVLWRALEQEPARRSLLIYGYFYPQVDELAFVDAIAGENSVFCLPVTNHPLLTQQKTVSAQLQARGWQIDTTELPLSETPGSWLANQFLSQQPGAATPARISAHRYPNQDAEIRGVLTQVKQLLRADIPAREIVVVARDEKACGPLLLDIAWEYGLPLRALYSIPLSATRVGAWLTLLLQVVQQQFPFELTARLLSHPLSISAGGDFWASVRRQRPERFEAWQFKVQDLLGLDLSPLKLPTTARRDTWVEKLQGILRLFNLRRRSARWAREIVAYNQLVEALVTLARPEEEILTQSDFIDQLLATLAVLTTPAQPGRGGVELHTPRSIMGAQYGYVFVIGALEGKLPQPVQNDRILDAYERRRLLAQGIPIPNVTDSARREEFEFYALLQTVTEQFTMSYSQVDGEPSAYFKRLGLVFTSAPTGTVASPEEARQKYLRHGGTPFDQVLERAIAAFEIEQQRESTAPPNEYDGIVGVPFDFSEHWFSVSQLTQLGQCPFKWFASRILKVVDVAEPEEDLNPGTRGNLYHKVVELALKALQEDPSLDITDEQRLHEWFLTAEQAINLPKLTAWDSRRIEHIRKLRQAMQHPDFWQPEREVLSLEAEFAGEWHGFNVKGFVDRIDRGEAGLILMDYKTSSSPPHGVKDANGKASIDLQLPLYQSVAAPALYPDEPVERAYYYSLRAAKDISPKRTTAEAELAAVAKRLKGHLNDGHYPVNPDVDRHACTYCSYGTLCRQGDRLDRKETPA